MLSSTSLKLARVSKSCSIRSVHVEAKIASLGLSMPKPAVPIASFVNYVRVGNMVYLSGHLPQPAEGGLIIGKIGKELTVEEGYEAAKIVGLNLCATLVNNLKDLDKVKRVVKLTGFVNGVDDFRQQPAVINGCSDLFVKIFGDVKAFICSDAFVFDHRFPLSRLRGVITTDNRIKSLKLGEDTNDISRRQAELESLINRIVDLTKGNASVPPVSSTTTPTEHRKTVESSQPKFYQNFSELLKKTQATIDADESRYYKKPEAVIDANKSRLFKTGVKNSDSLKSAYSKTLSPDDYVVDEDFAPVVKSPKGDTLMPSILRVLSAFIEVTTNIQTKLPSALIHSVLAVLGLFKGAVRAVFRLVWSLLSPPLSILGLATANALLWNYVVNLLLVNGPRYLPKAVLSLLEAQDLWVTSPVYALWSVSWLMWSLGHHLTSSNKSESRYKVVNGLQCLLYGMMRMTDTPTSR